MQLLQVFDSHAGELPKSLFTSFILPCLKRIGEGVKEKLGSELSVPMVRRVLLFFRCKYPFITKKKEKKK